MKGAAPIGSMKLVGPMGPDRSGGAQPVTSLLREVSDTLVLLVMAGLTLGGYVGLALILIKALGALGGLGVPAAAGS